MLKTLPWPANQVSVQPPLSQTRIGATLLMTRGGRWEAAGVMAGVRSSNSRRPGSLLAGAESSDRPFLTIFPPSPGRIGAGGRVPESNRLGIPPPGPGVGAILVLN